MNTDRDNSTRKEYVPPHIGMVNIPPADLLAASDEPPADNVIIDYDPEVDADGGGLSRRNHYYPTFETWE